MRVPAVEAATGMLGDTAAAVRVALHDALPEWLLRALASSMRYPLVIGAFGVCVTGAAITASLMHLVIVVADAGSRAVLTSMLALLLALGPAARLCLGATPPLVRSFAAVSPLLHALDLDRGRRAGQAFTAFLPLAITSCVIGAAAAASLSLTGEDEAAAAMLAASVVGVVTAALLAAALQGRPMIAGVAARGAFVLCGGLGLLSLLIAIGPQAQLLEALPLVSANATRTFCAVAAVSPALWIATEMLVWDARAPLRLARELVSCGASVGRSAAVVATVLALFALTGVPAAAAIALLAGSPTDAPAFAAVAWYLVVIAGVAVLLEPFARRVVPRATAFALLAVPGAVAVAQADSRLIVVLAAPAAVAAALAVTIGRLR